MDWITGLQRAIDYVEEHITEPIDYEEAAKRAYSSSFHFRVHSCGFMELLHPRQSTVPP